MAKQAVKPNDGRQPLDEDEEDMTVVDQGALPVQNIAPDDDNDLPDYLLRKGEAISGAMPQLQQQRIVEALLFAA